MADAPASPPPARNLAVPALVAALAALVYLNTLRGEFVYDDYPFIVNNPAVHTLAQPWKFLVDRAAMSEGGFYTIFRPMSGWCFSLLWAIAGPTPAVFHFANLAAHAAAAVCVWRLACAFGLAPRGGAMWAALVFAVHPVQTEAVAWIAGLANPLFVIGVTCATVRWLRWRASGGVTRDLAAVCAWYLFALLSKEHAVALPVLLLAVEWAVRPETSRPLQHRLGAILGLCLVTAAYVWWRSHVLGQTGQTGYWGGSLWTTLLTMAVGVRTYLRLLWAPLGLRPEYVIPLAVRWTEPRVLGSMLLIVALLLSAWRVRARSPRVALAVAWFFAALAPVSNVIPMKTLINERLLYLPMIGFGLLLGVVWDAWPRRAVRVALVAQLILFAVLTIVRNQDWQTSERLWTAAVAAEPRGYTSHFNLGEVYRQQGDTDAALHEFQRAIALRGRFPHAHGAVGNVYLARGEFHEAVRAFRRGVREKPADPGLQAGLATALIHWGDAALAEGRHATAAGAYQEALQLAPAHPAAVAGLAAAREANG